MDCKNFIKIVNIKIRNKSDISDKEKLSIVCKELQNKKYISFSKKQEFIKSVLKDVISFDNEKIKYNSCYKYYKFITSFISEYTGWEIDEECYDQLCSNDLLNYVINAIGTEYEVCLGIMNMYIEDLELGRLSYTEL